eukprot:611954-Rhodomonas_salina.1
MVLDISPALAACCKGLRVGNWEIGTPPGGPIKRVYPPLGLNMVAVEVRGRTSSGLTEWGKTQPS